ncbi:hypothetical protein R1X32_05710 (plasmid) [Rhodococcus opacus]|uniref:hypothetical protein n=1 Tax=Rhodococcus opacus TaxID=37919 RepID=UPI0034D20146
MRQIQHFRGGPDKILHIETEGCKVNVIIGTHDLSNEVFTTVEILPAEPDDDGRNWMTIGPTAVLVVPATGSDPDSWLFRDLAAANPTPHQNGSSS